MANTYHKLNILNTKPLKSKVSPLICEKSNPKLSSLLKAYSFNKTIVVVANEINVTIL